MPSHDDISRIFNKFAGKEIEMVESSRSVKIGGKDQTRTMARLADPQNPIIAEMREAAANIASQTGSASDNRYLNAVTKTSSSAAATMPMPAFTSVSSRWPMIRYTTAIITGAVKPMAA